MNDYGGPGRISWYLYNRLFIVQCFLAANGNTLIYIFEQLCINLLFSFLQVVNVMFTCLLCLLVRLNCPCSLSVLRVCNMMGWSVKNVQLLGIFHMKAAIPKTPRYLHYMRVCLCTCMCANGVTDQHTLLALQVCHMNNVEINNCAVYTMNYKLISR